MNVQISGTSWMILGAALLAVLAGPAAGEIPDVKVTTDRSIDCSSMETIARDLYRDCRTDEEKAIATWYFVRRLHFHWPHIPTWDSIDLINSYGFALCGYQSKMFCEICLAGGLKARTMHPPNHVIAEAFYDGAWHMFDCQVGWFAYRKDKSAVASCAEMKADPSIVTDAVKEGRASKPYFQCRDDPGSGTNYAANARTGGSPKKFTRRLVINLRRGESITRCWSNEGKAWHKPDETRWTSPHHGCTGQSIDANDPVNWPYWKPYAKIRSRAGDRVIYGIKRYYGNGRMVYEPDLATDSFTDGLAERGMEGAAARYQDGTGPNLHPAEVGKCGSVTFVVDSPYVAVDAWLDAAGVRKGQQDVLAIYAGSRRGKWQQVYRADQTGKLNLANVSLKPAAWGGHKYFVKIEFQAGADVSDVGIDSLKITTVFMNNMYSLPYFMPGKNVIRVTAAEGANLEKNPLSLEYVWQEQGKEKTLVKKVERVPFRTTVEVSGEELPRMKSVTLSVSP